MVIGVVGLGLIGGSFCRAIVKKTDHKVYALTRTQSTLDKAKVVEAYHEVLNDENIKDVDILILALYTSANIEAINRFAPKMKEGAIIMDCGGNKREICQEMEKLHNVYPHLNFIGAHPMAGKEFSGFSFSTETMFEKSTMIIVPIHTPIEALATLKKFALDIGFEALVKATPEEHDQMIAYTSQLSHVVASSYINSPLALTSYGFTGGSFRDMTRVARLNPEMWSELMLDNNDYLVQQIDVMINNLQEYKDAVERKDKEKLESLLGKGSEIKQLVELKKLEKLNKKD